MSMIISHLHGRRGGREVLLLSQRDDAIVAYDEVRIVFVISASSVVA